MPTKSHSPPPLQPSARPGDATLTVKKAARRARRASEHGPGLERGGPPAVSTGSTTAATGATASGTSSGSSRPRSPAHRRAGRGTGDGPRRATRRPTPAATITETAAGLDLLADLAEVASFPAGLDPSLDEACRRIRLATGAALVGIWERRPGRPRPPGHATSRARASPADRTCRLGGGLFDAALESPEPIHARPGDPARRRCSAWAPTSSSSASPAARRRGASSSSRARCSSGPTTAAGSPARSPGRSASSSAAPAATEQATSRLRRSEALRRVATDLASRLDVGDVVRDLSDHARVLFGADRVAVVLRDAEGRISSPGGTGFSDAFLAIARDLEQRRARGSGDIPPRRPVVLVGPDAPRSSSPIRAAAVQEGVDSLLVAPLVDGHELHGVVYLAHDRPHRWREPDLDAAEALAGDAAIAVRSARTFGRMAAWAAQLQSIQRLGARLSGPVRRARRSARDRDRAAAADRLRQRPRLPGPATRASCRSRCRAQGAVYSRRERRTASIVAVGEGITGWVARFRVPQLVDDTANDPRAVTIPGSEPDLDESMLLAPMVHEGVCLGVVVLGRLGPAPVHRGRPAAARDLRVVRRPGDGQRRRDPAAARAVRRARAPAARPAGAPARRPSRS